MSKTTRAYIYAILVSAGPLASFYGLASQEEIALWLGLGGTVLGVPAGALALKNLTPDGYGEPEIETIPDTDIETIPVPEDEPKHAA